jgi:hypothetical protein
LLETEVIIAADASEESKTPNLKESEPISDKTADLPSVLETTLRFVPSKS